MRISPAQPAEYASALQWLFNHLPDGEALRRANAAQALMESRSETPAQLLVARRDRNIVGASLMQVLVGATGVIWPPRGEDADVEDALTRHSLNWLKTHGAKIVQAILSVDETFLGEALVRSGFQHPTRLCYLTHELATLVKPGDEFEPVAAANQPEFHDTLWRSYEATQDFPEISGRRSLDDVLQGHRLGSGGVIKWWLLRESGKPAGVLLLEQLEGGRAADLVYLGVVPEARGCGLGYELTCKAMFEAKAVGAAELTLCVDARNAPARRIYDQLGFVEFDRREVFLALFGDLER